MRCLEDGCLRRRHRRSFRCASKPVGVRTLRQRRFGSHQVLQACIGRIVHPRFLEIDDVRVGRLLDLLSGSAFDDGQILELLDQWSTDSIGQFMELTVGVDGLRRIQAPTHVVRDLRRLKGPSQKRSRFNGEGSRSDVACVCTEAAAAVIKSAEENLAAIENLLSHLNARRLSTVGDGVLDSCLLKEVDFARELVTRVRQTLHRASAAKETLVFEPLPTDGALALMQNRLPSSWTAVWDGGPSADDVASYLNAVAQRVQYLRRLHTKDNSKDAPSQRHRIDSLRLGRLFRPRLLLGCLKRQAAKALRVPFDGLRVDAQWHHHHEPPSALQTWVVGLKLEGAQFDGQQLLPSSEVLRHHFSLSQSLTAAS